MSDPLIYTIKSKEDRDMVMERGRSGALEGCILNLDAKDYHSLKNYISSSVVAAVETSCQAAEHAFKKTFLPTESMALGTLIHEATLELDRFLSEYEIGPPVARNTRIWKEAFNEAISRGVKLLKSDTYRQVVDTARSIIQHPKVGPILRGGYAETSIFWQDNETGLMCRARPDYLTHDYLYVPDLKTTDRIDMRSFSKTVSYYQYHVKQAFYLKGVRAVFGTEARTGILIAAERTAPYEVQPYWLAPDDFTGIDPMAVGEYVVRKNMRVLKECIETDIWPRRSDEIEALELPLYVTKRYMDIDLNA